MRILLLTQTRSRAEALPELAGLMAHLREAGHCVDSLRAPEAKVADRPDRAAVYLHALTRRVTPDVVLSACADGMSSLAAGVMRATSAPGARPRFLRWVWQVPVLPRRREGLVGRMWKLAPNGAHVALRSADSIIAMGERLQEEIGTAGGGSSRRVHLVWPWSADVRCFEERAALREKLGLKGKFVVVHHGDADRGHDAVALSQAVEITRTDRGIVWLLAGAGPTPAQLRHGGDRELPVNVQVLPEGACTAEELLTLGDVNLVTHRPAAHCIAAARYLPPLLAARRPLLVVAPGGSDSLRVLRAHRAGIAMESGAGEMLARAVWQLRDSPLQQEVLRRAGRFAYERCFTPAAAYQRVEAILAEEHECS